MKMAEPKKPRKVRAKKQKKRKAATGAGGSQGTPLHPQYAAAQEKAVQPQPPAARDDAAPEAHMATVKSAVEEHASKLADGLATHGYAVVDDFLPMETVLEMRSEAESLLEGGRMAASQSTRWDAASGTAVAYEKHNVLMTNLAGGPAYSLSPRLVEYCVALVSSLPPLINARFPEAKLSAQIHTNKLAVCLGDGSRFDKHYDNSGGDDLRKLTVLIYLQEHWSEVNGGCFRMFVPPEHSTQDCAGLTFGRAAGLEDFGGGTADDHDRASEKVLHSCVDIAPLGGRLLAFWSDAMVHGVLPSFAPTDDAQRWALTIWLHTEDPAAIQFDAAMEEAHFLATNGGHRALAG